MIADFLLPRICKYNEAVRHGHGSPKSAPLRVLHREYPDLAKLVNARRVLDFGCGHGDQAAALSDLGANVVGLDTNLETLSKARELHPKVEFVHQICNERFDVIISQNAMEHFSDPAAVLSTMRDALNSEGKILITFGPPWYSPAGSHMGFFCPLPWANLLFTERAVMRERAKYVQDGAKRYEEVTSGLNKMSVSKFERLVRQSGLFMERYNYHTVKGVPLIGSIPIVRELFINHITVMLAHLRQ